MQPGIGEQKLVSSTLGQTSSAIFGAGSACQRRKIGRLGRSISFLRTKCLPESSSIPRSIVSPQLHSPTECAT